MRVDLVSDVAIFVTENSAHCIRVRIGGIQHGCYSVAAVMGRMFAIGYATKMFGKVGV